MRNLVALVTAIGHQGKAAFVKGRSEQRLMLLSARQCSHVTGELERLPPWRIVGLAAALFRIHPACPGDGEWTAADAVEWRVTLSSSFASR